MVNFAEGELALPIRKILWAPTNAAHADHLHVEGPHVSGTLASCTSKWTEAITEIRGALDGYFGEGDHYEVWDDTLAWTHMGVYNCRTIAGSSTPSQHAFSNAIDIGPYYGVAQQQVFYDFLTRKEEDMELSQEALDQIEAIIDAKFDEKLEINSNGISLLEVRSVWNVPHGGRLMKDNTVDARKAAEAVDARLAE